MDNETIIKNIAETLDMGERVFLHRETQEILAYPATDDSEFAYLADEVHEVVDANPDAYLQFDPPTSHESYRIMEEFAESRTDKHLKLRLLDALNAKKPFRSFRNAVEDAGVEDDWYDYKDAYLQMLVRDKLS